MSEIESFPPSQASASQLPPVQPKKPKPKRTNFTVSKVSQPIPLSCWSNAPYRELRWSHRVEAGMCATFNSRGDKVVLEIIKGSELIHQIILSDLSSDAKALSKLIFSKVSIMIRYPFPMMQDFHQPFTMHRIQLTLPPAQVKALLVLITPFFPPAADETKCVKQVQPKATVHSSQIIQRQQPHPYIPRHVQAPVLTPVAASAPPRSIAQSPAQPQTGPAYHYAHGPLPSAQFHCNPSNRPFDIPKYHITPPWRESSPWAQPAVNHDQMKEDPAVAKSFMIRPVEVATDVAMVKPVTPRRIEQPLICFDTPEAAASTVRYPPLAPDNVDTSSITVSTPTPNLPRNLPQEEVPQVDESITVKIQKNSTLFNIEDDGIITDILQEIMMEPGFVPFVLRVEGIIANLNRTSEK